MEEKRLFPLDSAIPLLALVESSEKFSLRHTFLQYSVHTRIFVVSAE